MVPSPHVRMIIHMRKFIFWWGGIHIPIMVSPYSSLFLFVLIYSYICITHAKSSVTFSPLWNFLNLFWILVGISFDMKYFLKLPFKFPYLPSIIFLNYSKGNIQYNFKIGFSQNPTCFKLWRSAENPDTKNQGINLSKPLIVNDFTSNDI